MSLRAPRRLRFGGEDGGSVEPQVPAQSPFSRAVEFAGEEEARNAQAPEDRRPFRGFQRDAVRSGEPRGHNSRSPSPQGGHGAK
jgi:hypothetical protein